MCPSPKGNDLISLEGRSQMYEVGTFRGSAYSGRNNFLIENSFWLPVGGPCHPPPLPPGLLQPRVTTAVNIWYRTLLVRFDSLSCNVLTCYVFLFFGLGIKVGAMCRFVLWYLTCVVSNKVGFLCESFTQEKFTLCEVTQGKVSLWILHKR